MISLVYAMGGGGTGAAGGQGSSMGAFIPLILMFVIFYFLLIRPQQKKAKLHKEMLGALKKGDRVISAGGLYGEVTGITDEVVILEIAPKVRVKVSRGSVTAVLGKEQSPQQSPKA
jgi:preprotein translocase subunit YajC